MERAGHQAEERIAQLRRGCSRFALAPRWVCIVFFSTVILCHTKLQRLFSMDGNPQRRVKRAERLQWSIVLRLDVCPLLADLRPRRTAEVGSTAGI